MRTDGAVLEEAPQACGSALMRFVMHKFIRICMCVCVCGGGGDGVVVKALRYEQAGRGFDSR